jgi:hypothetical protein
VLTVASGGFSVGICVAIFPLSLTHWVTVANFPGFTPVPKASVLLGAEACHVSYNDWLDSAIPLA